MYQRKNLRGFSNRKIFFASGVLMATSLLWTNAAAQWTNEKSHLFQNNNVKHYATAALNGTDQYLMAGTLFAPNLFDNSVHFMFIDNTGNTTVSRVIDDPAYDERVMSVHYMGANDALIIASRIDPNNPGTGNDGIEVLRVDGAGNLLPSSTIINGTTAGAENLYPLSSLQFSNQYLFICGYATPAGSNMPSIRSNKYAFVLKYDMIADQVVDIRLINNGGPAAAPYDYDYDIAARMKVVSGGLWIGGSINPGLMMNRIINPVTMTDILVRSTGTIVDRYHFESSYDIMEQPNGDFMLFGNNAAVVEMPGVWNAWATPYPQQMHVTGLRPDLVAYPGQNRWIFRLFDFAWGVNTISGSEPYSVIISGMESNRTCNAPYTTSSNNINPFLTEIKPRMIGNNLNVVTFFWNTILSSQGTGPISSIFNYSDLGYPVSNLVHTPITTVRDKAATNDIVLTSPVWNAYVDQQSMKWIRTDMNGRLDVCPWAAACEDDQTYTGVRGIISGVNTLATAVATYATFNNNPFRADYEYDCDTYFKPTGIASLNKKVVASIAPNPASEYVHISLSDKGSAAHLEVRLTDLTGRDVAALYSGSSEALPERLNLPKLAPGIYLLQIKQGTERAETMKLSIR